VKVVAYNGHATVLADMDFESYSEAGYVRNPVTGKWTGKGLADVGAPAYSEHPSTLILCLAYDLKDGKGSRLWLPETPPPVDLFAYLAAGGLIEAHNSGFEFYLWKNICAARMGWPRVSLDQFRCSMSKCVAFGLPGALDKVGAILNAEQQKDKRGKQLIQLLCRPKTPTRKVPQARNTDPALLQELYDYCGQDIAAESAISTTLPDLSPYEQQVWLMDQRINTRGVYIDRAALDDCIYVVNAATEKYTDELQRLTGGMVQTADELAKLQSWLALQGVRLPSVDADTIEAALERDDLTPNVRRALWIRSSVGSRSVKKLHAIKRRLCADGRLRDLFAYYGAGRTGRWAGRGPQPQNLPASGPPTAQCDACGSYSHASLEFCPFCACADRKAVEWGADVVRQALLDIASRDINYLERAWIDPLAVVCGCLRGLFVAAPGHDLICSDFSAIEAVVIAAISGCEWRLEVFRTHGKIYEMSAAKITGVSFDTMMQYKAEHGEHHPLRKKVGKVAELASGYQGWIGAWKNFGADKFMNDDEIKDAILAWRDASPEIPALWKGLERAFLQAALNPGTAHSYRGITYGVMQDVMFCILPSGRQLKYHAPRAIRGVDDWGRDKWFLSFEGWNSDYKKGPIGWMRIDTYGGKLTENAVQAIARDIQANAMLKLEAKGYPIVLHVHDEACSEVPQGQGSVEEYEQIMVDALAWFATWPIKAAGGWRGDRYRKD
jgi:DNA polymerase